MKVAILDKVHPLIEEALVEKGWQCDNLFESSREELLSVISKYNGIVLRSRIEMDQAFLEHAVNLKFIGRPGAGLENIDLKYCEKKGIKVFRSPEGNRDAVAEHALVMILSLFTNLKRADNEVRKGIWLREENRGQELMGKTVGIIGYGYMGEAFAQRLKGFGVRVIAYDKYITNFGNDFVEEGTLETLFEEADVVSLHTPLTEDTIGMIDATFLSKFKKPIYFINTARGKSVVTKDLVEAMKGGNVIGVCLDVLEYESSSFTDLDIVNLPEPMQYLIHSEQAVLTPHIAGWTHEAKYKMGKFLAEKIVNAFN